LLINHKLIFLQSIGQVSNAHPPQQSITGLDAALGVTDGRAGVHLWVLVCYGQMY
jgi:hypothetical protein